MLTTLIGYLFILDRPLLYNCYVSIFFSAFELGQFDWFNFFNLYFKPNWDIHP